MRTLTHHRKTFCFVMVALLALAGSAGALWWGLFALKPYGLTPQALQARYAHATPASKASAVRLGPPQPITVGAMPAWAAELRYESFDGDAVVGRIVWPEDPRRAAAAPRPVLLALHGMGRTQWRWWQAEFKGRPTIENTHLVAEQALRQGHVVLALDARRHGERKDPQNPLLAQDLMRELHLWGRREPYERLIIDTVKDYRVLLDWVQQQPGFDAARVRAAGYSMGAQMALLLAGTDPRVRSVAAMVPPHLDGKVAAVAPLSVAQRLQDVPVWLLTADEDDYATVAQNAALFAALPGPRSQHLRFASGHLLPAAYAGRLQAWLAAP
jgi:dienelactone hydrolase